MNEHRAMVVPSHRNGKDGIRVVFEELPQPFHSFVLDIFADDRNSLCSLSAATIWSVALEADAWKNLTILGVSRDRKTFLYKNKVGMVKRAKVGDTITRAWGKVRAISGATVSITELEEDGRGGFKEVERVLSMNKTR